MFDIEWIKTKVSNREEYFSAHGEQERQNDNPTIAEVNEALGTSAKVPNHNSFSHFIKS